MQPYDESDLGKASANEELAALKKRNALIGLQLQSVLLLIALALANLVLNSVQIASHTPPIQRPLNEEYPLCSPEQSR